MKSTVLVKSAGLAVVAFVCLVLASCGGESNNLKDPTATVSTSCTALYSESCVTGRLVDDVAYNVDYSCGLSSGGTVQSVTGTDGSFSCPAGSNVTFSIINPDHNTDTDKKIVLGQALVVAPADLYGVKSGSSSSSGSTPPTVYTYLTPRNLTGDIVNASAFTGDYHVFGTATLNIVRLLQTLGRGDVINAAAEGTPAHRIVLTDEDKRQLTNLADSVKASDFFLPPASSPSNPEAGSFDAKVASFLQSLQDPQKHVLISPDAAAAALQSGIYSFASGMYTVPGSLFTASGTGSSGGLSGSNATYGQMLGSLYLLVDRQGRMLGSGTYSLETTNTSTQTLWTNPKALELYLSGQKNSAGFVVWPNNFSLTSTSFRLLDSNGAATTKTLNLTQGSIERHAIAGTPTLYTNLFHEAVDTSKLGQWALYDGPTNLIASSEANYTLAHTVESAPTLDPDLWVGNADNVKAKLPMAVTAYFCNSDAVTAPDVKCNSTGAVIATVRFVILPDGNIVSDIYQHCGIDAGNTAGGGLLDPVTLQYSSTTSVHDQEVPLGTVASIFSPTSSGMTFMSLLFMVPNTPYYAGLSQYLPYAQMAGNVGSSSLLRVDGNTTTNSSYLKLYTSSTDSNNNPVYTADASGWGNALTTYLAFAAEHQDNPTNDPNISYSPATIALQNNAQGLLITIPTAAADCH
jgi:hypothetical protein